MKRCLRVIVLLILLSCLTFVLMQTALAAEMRVAGTDVNFRTGPSLDAGVIRALDSGTGVEVLEHDPAGWSKVRISGTVGYIRSDFLTVPAGVGLRTTDVVNFRTGPSLDASVITSLSVGTGVEVVEHDPSGWSKVKVSGTVGYVRSDFLALPIQNAQQTVSVPAASVPAQTPATLKTTDGVNFRTGPSTDTGIIRTLSANTSVEVLERDPAGWTKVRIDGTVGYIRSDLLSVNGRNVELLDWSVVKNIMKTGATIPVYDVRTGITFNIRCFSKGVHADVEPITKADTDTVFQIRNGVWSWAARPVWVTIEGRVIAASINGMPHDVSTIADNGLNGHFCLHFLGSTTSSTSASYRADLQNAVMEAWNAR